MKKPFSTHIIALLMLFVSLGALFGGFSLIKDPTGNDLKLPANYLQDTLFQNYFYPGLILFLIIGVCPLVILYGLFRKDSLKFLNAFRMYKDLSWQWNFSAYYGFALVIWINFQIAFVPYFILQPIVSLIGVLVLAIIISPSFRSFHKM